MSYDQETNSPSFKHAAFICKSLSILCTIACIAIILWAVFVVSVMVVSMVRNDLNNGATTVSPLVPIFYLIYGVNASVIPLILGKMVRDLLTQRTPFTLKNAHRLNVIAWVLIAYSILGTLLGYMDSHLNMSIQNNTVKVGDMVRDFTSNIATTLDIFPLVIAGVFFVLSYVFKYGVLLQQESDETL